MNSTVLLNIVKAINSFLTGKVLVVGLLGVGLLFSFKLKFIQLTKIKTAVHQLLKKQKDNSKVIGMSSFQSLSTAIAAQVGTGNLAGVATAITTGGPGAIFWMWISAFFGMSTIFAEAVLAQLFRKNDDGEFVGGPAYYIKYGIKSNFLAGFFAVSIILALGFMGNMVQSNSIAVAVNSAFNIPRVIIGIAVATLAFLIFSGGVKRIASFTEKVVPFMAILYIIGSLIIIILNHQNILPAFKMIFVGAFNPKAATGGFIGATVKDAIRYGVSRGLFSNEAGMGSTPHAHAVAKVQNPSEQGFVAILGVIVDTFIICTLTSLVILTTGVLESGLTGAELTQKGFEVGFNNVGNIGTYFIAISLFFFAFSTIIGWSYFGETNVKFLFGKKSIKYYKLIVPIMIIIGTLLKVDLVWELADTFNSLMVIPNLIALIGLSKLVSHTLKKYENASDIALKQ